MKTLDDIIPPSRRAQMQADAPRKDAPPPSTPRQYRPSRFPWATTIVVLVIIAIAVGALFYFSGAEVEVTPDSSSAAASGSYTAVAAATSTDSLPFQIISAQQSTSQSVAATGTQNVSSNASGTITIYNTQSVTQHLIANTRFETTGGLVFRIHAEVSIPAGGSVSATVYADQPGSQYNVGPSSFTVPGLANTPQFSAVYAKSTDAMTGGASGTEPVIDPTAEANAVTALQATLAPQLMTALTAQVPAGYVLLPGAASTTYSEQPVTGSGSSATVSEQGTVTAVVFPNADLAKAIAENGLGASYDGEPYTIQNPQALTLSAASLPDASSQSFSFSLAGTASLIATIDANQIASAVAGKSRDAAQVALTSYPAVKSAVLILRPFWKSEFPEDPSSIKVVVENAGS